MGALTEYTDNTVNLSTDDRPFKAYKDDCTSIVIGDGITSIGYRDFAFMNSVRSVSIPASVTTIGGYAFYRGSSSNPAITFTIASGSQLSSIGDLAFMNTKATIDLCGHTLTHNYATSTGNTWESSAYNVFLGSSSVITITGALTSDSRIGVNTGGNRAITSGADGNAVLANFTSDDADYYICWNADGTEVQMNGNYYLSERDGMADLVSRHRGR